LIDIMLNNSKRFNEVTKNPAMIVPIKQNQTLVDIIEEDY